MSLEQHKILETELEQIPAVLAFFNLGEMQNATLLSGGYANHNYAVKTPQGEVVVKFTIEETRESLENDRAIEEQLQQAGIGTSVYIERPDGQFIFDQGKRAVVSTKIEGIHPPEITPEISAAIGNVLARFHQAVHELPHPHHGWLSPETVAKPIPQEDELLTKKAREFIAAGQYIYDLPLPRGIVYGDLHQWNLLVNEYDQTKVEALFDFEEAEHNIFLVDLVRTMLSVCEVADGEKRKVSQELMDAFVQGYSAVRPLSAEEREHMRAALKYAAGACMLWFMKNGFVRDAEKMVERIESLGR